MVTFDGGDEYDVYGLVDVDLDGDLSSGDLMGSQLGVEVDGNIAVTFAYASLVAVP